MDHGGSAMLAMPGMPGMDADLPPFTLGRGLAFGGDPFFLVLCVVLLALYGWGVARLIRRGDRWPVGRTVSFAVGVLTVGVTMCTKLNDYGMAMFSVHMVQHMVLSMLSPLLLLLGAPVTLALRSLPTAGRGRTGPRELLVAFLHSRLMRVVTHPAFTIPLFVASLYGLYFTPIFDDLMRSQTGHIAMMLHFLAVGLVFFWPIMGIDPGPHRPGYVMRMLELFAGMPFHAFFGIALMMASEPMVSTFKHPPASLNVHPLSDQTAAGGIAWAFSEIPSVVVLVALLFQWYTSEKRQARRTDRAAERNGDAELVAYNAYLASLQARGRG
ncbi:putative copper resistance protein D [Actinacidiphila yanglinensis]|uniref:Putative copper resistance protein D n=1 Tax=Actinacidiphila yanglinensis TaxID=310779 RepID=A0A1H6CBS2_9ACTN|nr:cytochrome c oxidase assembly protein [Actinacidiphila yanglinensis]SEG70394.1 putative copper resistance protein D [Actinacidiphila yanglinensis]